MAEPSGPVQPLASSSAAQPATAPPDLQPLSSTDMNGA